MQSLSLARAANNWQYERNHPMSPRPGLALLIPILLLALALWYLRFGRSPK